MASQETYEWSPCKIEIIASEDWQPDSVFEVKVRITVTSEISYKLRIHSVKVIVSSEGFSYYDTKLDDIEFGTLGEYREKAFSFNFSTDKLSRGENFTVSIVAIIDMYKLIGIWEYEQLWYNSDDLMMVNLYMPPAPSPTPTITTAPEPPPEPFPTTLVIAIAILVVICAGLLLYFRKQAIKQRDKTKHNTTSFLEHREIQHICL